MPDRSWRALVLALAVAFAVAPALSSGFGGFDAADFPVRADWPAQPAGWAFSIWGVIYAGLIGSAAWGFLRAAPGDGWGRACPPLALSLAFGAPWVEIASRAPVAATAMLLPMAAGAVAATFRSGPAFWQRGPLGLYAGWVTAATWIGISAVLTGYGAAGPQAVALFALFAALATALAVSSLLPPGAWTFRLAVCWALVGVIAANVAPSGGQTNWPIVMLSATGIAALGADAGRRLRMAMG
jgi:hypothetical protein